MLLKKSIHLLARWFLILLVLFIFQIQSDDVSARDCKQSGSDYKISLSFQSENQNSTNVKDPQGFSSIIRTHWILFISILLIIVVAISWSAYKLVTLRENPHKTSYSRSEIFFREENLLRTLIDNMPDFIYIKDTNSKFIVANKKLADVHGYKNPIKLEGKTDYDLYPKDLANRYYWDEQEIIASKKALIGHEETGLNEKGETIYVLTTKIPLINNDGEVVGIVGIGRDITDRKKTEEKLIEHSKELQHKNTLLEEKQEEIAQQSEELKVQAENLQNANLELDKLSIVARETDNVVIILDAEGNFEWVNQSFTRVYGYDLDHFITEKGKNILQASFNPHIKEILTKCRQTKETIRYQSEALNKDGQQIWTQSTLTPILNEDDKITRFVAIDSDITAIKKAQELISNQKHEIEVQRDKLERLNITKDKFFSIIAHDLRNPFHSIMGFSDLLVKDYFSIDDEKKVSYLELIKESSEHAHNLLENLLQWSRAQMDSIKYNPAEMDLFPVLDEIRLMLHASLEKKELSLSSEVQKGTIIYADKNMVDTILRNLLNNAIKFTPHKGKIHITAEKQGDFMAISIADNGIGIKPEDQQRLFRLDEFHSTKGTAGEAGTGLGLIICQEFVNQHGGEISFKTTTGKGTKFTFTLPVSSSG